MSKTKITLIAAMDKNRVIGANGALPWHLPEDFKHFKAHTINKCVLMGRHTYDSMGRALPQRRNVVVTRNQGYRLDDAKVYHSLHAAMAALKDEAEVFILGGGTIFEAFLPQADQLILTIVDATLNGDTRFPQWDEANWVLQEDREYAADTHNQYNMRFMTLTRKS